MNFSTGSPNSRTTRPISSVIEVNPEKNMNTPAFAHSRFDAPVKIPVNGVALEGLSVVASRAKGVVRFADGSGSGRLSPRNNFVAQNLHQAGNWPACNRRLYSSSAVWMM